MSRTSLQLAILMALVATSFAGCYRHGRRRMGPPPPAYACDSYGCDNYDDYGDGFSGGYGECVDDGQYVSRRDQRRARRDDRKAYRRGSGKKRDRRDRHDLPVVAAYLIPMESGCSTCGCGCSSGFQPCGGFSAGDCGPCGSCGSSGSQGFGMANFGGSFEMPMGAMGSSCGPNGCMVEGHQMGNYPAEDYSQWQPYQSGELVPTPSQAPTLAPLQVAPSEAYPYGSDGVDVMDRIPVPPVEEGEFAPPGTMPSPPSPSQPTQRGNPSEPSASRPLQTINWLPNNL